MRRSIFFCLMKSSKGIRLKRKIISCRFLSRRATAPSSMSTVNPRTYLMQTQYTFPDKSFFALTEYSSPLGKEGNIHLSYLAVPSNTCLLNSGSPCTTVMKSSTWKSIWGGLSRVCVWPGPFSVLSDMLPYLVIGINVLTMALAELMSISEKAQNNLGGVYPSHWQYKVDADNN